MWEKPMGMGYDDYGRSGGWMQNQMPRRGMYGYNQQLQSNMCWIRVNGPQGMRDVMVPPSGEAWGMDENRQVFYYKRANEMGQTSIDAYTFEKISLEDIENGQASGKYATREDLEQIKTEVAELKKFANDLGGANL